MAESDELCREVTFDHIMLTRESLLEKLEEVESYIPPVVVTADSWETLENKAYSLLIAADARLDPQLYLEITRLYRDIFEVDPAMADFKVRQAMCVQKTRKRVATIKEMIA